MVAHPLTVSSTEATHVAAIEAVYSSINPAVATADINRMLISATRLVATMQSYPTNARRAFYIGLAKAFDRIREKRRGESIDLNEVDLKSLLFRSEDIEALRLVRADALVAICKTSPALKAKLSTDISALRADEKALTVRNRLDTAS